MQTLHGVFSLTLYLLYACANFVFHTNLPRVETDYVRAGTACFRLQTLQGAYILVLIIFTRRHSLFSLICFKGCNIFKQYLFSACANVLFILTFPALKQALPARRNRLCLLLGEVGGKLGHAWFNAGYFAVPHYVGIVRH